MCLVYRNCHIRFTLLLFVLLLACAYSTTGQVLLAGSGKCLALDGNNDYINAGLQNRGVTNAVTVEAWIKTDNFDYTWIAGKYSNSLGEDGGYHLYLINGKVGFNGRDGSGNYRASGLSQITVTDNNWHHVAGVCNNGRWEVWVDGILESFLNTGYLATDLTTQNVPLTFGNYYDYNSNFYRGDIDEIRIWKTARTRDQLRANMSRKFTAADPNLVAYFRFDETNGNTFKDFSLSNSAGTINGSSGNNAIVTSGAPIGDESLATYQNSWGTTNLYIPGVTNHVFEINKISANTKGIHLYWVNSLPNTLNGIAGNTFPSGYYGVYTVAPNEVSSYAVNYTSGVVDKCPTLFRRNDNAQNTWDLLATTNNNGTLIKNNEEYRGEYIFNSTEIAPVTISGKAQICSGESTSLQAIAPGVTRFLWSTGETTNAIQVNKGGTYTVKAFTTDQCFTESSLVITETEIPRVVITGDTLLCPGAKIELRTSGSGFTRYLWSTGETTSTIQINQPGNYSVKAFVTDACFSESSLAVKAIGLSNVTISGETKVCSGSATRLQANASGVNKFVWSTGETTLSIQVTNPGTYSVKAYITDQCFTEASILVETIRETTLPPVEVAGVSICPNNPATLVPTAPGGVYQWYDAAIGGNLLFEGNSFTTPPLAKTTTFYVQVKNNNVCNTAPRTPVTVLISSNLIASAGNDTTITTGSTIVLRGQGGDRFHWEPALGLNNPEVQQPVANPTKTTTYRLTTYSKEGCEATSEVTITVLPPITLVNTFSPNQDGANDIWEIPQIENYPGARVQIFNRWGATIYKSEDGYKKPWDGTYQGKDLPLATYYYLIHLDKKSAPLSGNITLIR